MSQLYSGRIRAELSSAGFSFSIAGFDDSLNLKVVGPRVTIADKPYNLGTIKFGHDEQAFRAALTAMNVNLHMVTVFGKTPEPLTEHLSVERFDGVTFDQLVTAGLLVPVN